MGSSVETVVSDAAAGADQVAYLCLGDAGDTVDRRNNAGEIEIDAGGLDCGLAGLNLSLRSSDGRFRGLHLGLIGKVCLGCVVEILLADGIQPLPEDRTSPHRAGS